MASEWVATTIGELCDRVGGDIQTGPFGSQLHAHDYVYNGPVPVVTTSSVGRRRIVADGVPRVSREKADSLRRHYLRSGDIIFARRGVQAAGLSALIESDHSGWLGGTGIIRLRLPAKAVDPKYLSFVLSARRTYDWIRQHAIGATMPNLNEGVVRRLPVELPPLPEQRRIAAVLGVLDDKIELNRKMNQTLEAMAQALFKSWFVDFDPVIDNALRADNPIPDDLADKAERRRAVMAREDYAIPEYAGLFPNGFDDSELGSIPVGWSDGELGDVAYQHRESVDPTMLPPEIAYFGLADMPERSWSLSTWGKAADVNSNKSEYKAGDILFGKLRPYFKKVGVAPNDGVCSSDILVIRSKEAAWWGFVLGVLTHDPFIDFTTAVSTGTRMPRVSWKNMSGYRLAMPSSSLALRFDALVRSAVEKTIGHNFESKTLSGLRDTLLPKLISGEIRVPADVTLPRAAEATG